MADVKLDHLPFLPSVLARDLEHIVEKDKSYGGSWKKRGGVGAFMMLARKWDRLEVMMLTDMTFADRYDILTRAGLEGSAGEDGTVLAEIRDLRRYLALVESEILRALLSEPTTTPIICVDKFSTVVQKLCYEVSSKSSAKLAGEPEDPPLANCEWRKEI